MAYRVGEITSFRGLEFTITEDHLKLLKRACWESNEECEFGSVALDCKRPFGNSDVYGDMHEILKDGARRTDGEFSDEVIQKYNHLFFQELPVVLEIICVTGSVQIGTYRRPDEYRHQWKLVNPTTKQENK